jgi:GNAT superfamily N-acetyltransferase
VSPRRAPEAAPLGAIEVVPATADRWPALETLFGGDGDRGCWCQYWRASSSDYRTLGLGGGRRALWAQLAGAPAPGVVAYLEDEPAGWCGIGPRASMERLVRSRTIPAVDDRPVWSVVCFKVRPGFRRRGVARALLAGAVAYAREQGAPAVEAYPIDATGDRLDVAFSYVGFVSTFEAAGFVPIVETAARSAGRPRVLMRLEL